MSEDKKPLTPHPIVAKLAADPAAPLDTAQFVGYVGKSTRPEHHRLYLSLQLDEYIDIPFAAVVHHEDIPDTEMEHGGTRVWVDAGATVVHETRQTTRTEARFLEGSIADEYLQDTTADPSQFAMPYTPYCRTNEGACTAYSCDTCIRCPGGANDQQFGTMPNPTPVLSCGGACVTPARTCGSCIRTCAATCRGTCVTCFTCPRTCATTCRPSCFTCQPSCPISCRQTCVPCTPRCLITRQPQCLANTPACPVATPACPG